MSTIPDWGGLDMASLGQHPQSPHALPLEFSLHNEQDFVDTDGDGSNENDNTKKRHRRTFSELERSFVCGYPACGRPYASEHALNQHIRLKHANHSPGLSRSRASSASVNFGVGLDYVPNSSDPYTKVPIPMFSAHGGGGTHLSPVTTSNPSWQPTPTLLSVSPARMGDRSPSHPPTNLRPTFQPYQSVQRSPEQEFLQSQVDQTNFLLSHTLSGDDVKSETMGARFDLIQSHYEHLTETVLTPDYDRHYESTGATDSDAFLRDLNNVNDLLKLQGVLEHLLASNATPFSNSGKTSDNLTLGKKGSVSPICAGMNNMGINDDGSLSPSTPGANMGYHSASISPNQIGKTNTNYGNFGDKGASVDNIRLLVPTAKPAIGRRYSEPPQLLFDEHENSGEDYRQCKQEYPPPGSLPPVPRFNVPPPNQQNYDAPVSTGRWQEPVRADPKDEESKQRYVESLLGRYRRTPAQDRPHDEGGVQNQSWRDPTIHSPVSIQHTPLTSPSNQTPPVISGTSLNPWGYKNELPASRPIIRSRSGSLSIRNTKSDSAAQMPPRGRSLSRLHMPTRQPYHRDAKPSPPVQPTDSPMCFDSPSGDVLSGEPLEYFTIDEALLTNPNGEKYCESPDIFSAWHINIDSQSDSRPDIKNTRISDYYGQQKLDPRTDQVQRVNYSTESLNRGSMNLIGEEGVKLSPGESRAVDDLATELRFLVH